MIFRILAIFNAIVLLAWGFPLPPLLPPPLSLLLLPPPPLFFFLFAIHSVSLVEGGMAVTPPFCVWPPGKAGIVQQTLLGTGFG